MSLKARHACRETCLLGLVLFVLSQKQKPFIGVKEWSVSWHCPRMILHVKWMKTTDFPLTFLCVCFQFHLSWVWSFSTRINHQGGSNRMGCSHKFYFTNQCVFNTVLNHENNPSLPPRHDSAGLRSPCVADNAVTFLSEKGQCNSNSIPWHATATPITVSEAVTVMGDAGLVRFIFRNVGIYYETLRNQGFCVYWTVLENAK